VGDSTDACPLRARSAGETGAITVTRGHEATLLDLRSGWPASPDPKPSKLELPSSSPHDRLSRVLRIKAKPLRGRFASLDTSVMARGMAAMRRTGEVGRRDRYTSARGRHAISVPLATAPSGKLRCFTVSRIGRSYDITASY